MPPGEGLASRRRRFGDKGESPRGGTPGKKKTRGKERWDRNEVAAEADGGRTGLGPEGRGGGDGEAEKAAPEMQTAGTTSPLPAFPSLGIAPPSRRLWRLAKAAPSHAPALSLLALALWALETAVPLALSTLLAVGRTDVASDVLTGLRLALREPVRRAKADATAGLEKARGAVAEAWEEARRAVGERLQTYLGEAAALEARGEGGRGGRGRGGDGAKAASRALETIAMAVAAGKDEKAAASIASSPEPQPIAPQAPSPSAGQSVAALGVRLWLRLRGAVASALGETKARGERGPTAEEASRAGPRSAAAKAGRSPPPRHPTDAAASRADAVLASALLAIAVLVLPPTRRLFAGLAAGLLAASRALFVLPLSPFRPLAALAIELASPGASCVAFFALFCSSLGLLAQLVRPKGQKADPDAAAAAQGRLRSGLAVLAAGPLCVALSGGWTTAGVALLFFSAAVAPWVQGAEVKEGAEEWGEGDKAGGGAGVEGGRTGEGAGVAGEGEGAGSAAPSSTDDASAVPLPLLLALPPLPVSLAALLALSLFARLLVSLASLVLLRALPSLVAHPRASLRALAAASRRALVDAPAEFFARIDATFLTPWLASPVALLVAARAPLPRGRGWATAAGRADLWLAATLTAWLWRRAANDPAARAALALGALSWIPPSCRKPKKRAKPEGGNADAGGEDEDAPASTPPGRLRALLRRVGAAALGERRAESAARALGGFERRSAAVVVDLWLVARARLWKRQEAAGEGVPDGAREAARSSALLGAPLARALNVVASLVAAFSACLAPLATRSRALLRAYARAVAPAPSLPAAAGKAAGGDRTGRSGPTPALAPPRLAPWLPLLFLSLGRRAAARGVEAVARAVAGGGDPAQAQAVGSLLVRGAPVGGRAFVISKLLEAVLRAIRSPALSTTASPGASGRAPGLFSLTLALALLPLLCWLGRLLGRLATAPLSALVGDASSSGARSKLAYAFASLFASRDPDVDGWTPPFTSPSELAWANGRMVPGPENGAGGSESASGSGAPSEAPHASGVYRATDAYAFQPPPLGAPSPAWRVVPPDEVPTPPGAWGAPWSLHAPVPAVPLLSLRKKRGVPVHLGEEAPEGATEVVQRILAARNYYEVLGFGVDGRGLFGGDDGDAAEGCKGAGSATVLAKESGDGKASTTPSATGSGSEGGTKGAPPPPAASAASPAPPPSAEPSDPPPLPDSLYPTTLSPDALDERVRRARRRLALLTHPDRASGRAPGAPRAFELVTLAAEALETGPGREAYLEGALKPPMDVLDVVAAGMGLTSLVFGEAEAQRGASAGELLLTLIEQHVDELERGALLWPCRACGRVHAVLPLPGRSRRRARAWTVDDDGKRLKKPVLLPAEEHEIWLERGTGGGAERFGVWGNDEGEDDYFGVHDNDNEEGDGEGDGTGRGGDDVDPSERLLRDGGVIGMYATESRRGGQAAGSEGTAAAAATDPGSAAAVATAYATAAAAFFGDRGRLSPRSLFVLGMERLKALPVRLAFRLSGALLWRLRAARRSRQIRVLLCQSGRVWDFTEPGACQGYLSNREMLAFYPFGAWENPFAAALGRGAPRAGAQTEEGEPVSAGDAGVACASPSPTGAAGEEPSASEEDGAGGGGRRGGKGKGRGRGKGGKRRA